MKHDWTLWMTRLRSWLRTGVIHFLQLFFTVKSNGLELSKSSSTFQNVLAVSNSECSYNTGCWITFPYYVGKCSLGWSTGAYILRIIHFYGLEKEFFIKPFLCCKSSSFEKEKRSIPQRLPNFLGNQVLPEDHRTLLFRMLRFSIWQRAVCLNRNLINC